MKKKSRPPEPPQRSLRHLAARTLVGGVLLYAGFSKAVGPVGELAASIEFYRVLPMGFVILFAHVLPWLEIYVGLSVFTGYFLKVGARAATVLFAIFICVLSQALIRGIDPASCGCFGEGVRLSLPVTLSLDGLFLGVSLFLGRNPSPSLSLDQWIRRAP